MGNRLFNVRSILAGEAPKDVAITVKGWVRTRRDSKAGISLIHLSDGSSFHSVQVVAPNTLSNYLDAISYRYSTWERQRCKGEIDVVIRRLLQMGDLL